MSDLRKAPGRTSHMVESGDELFEAATGQWWVVEKVTRCEDVTTDGMYFRHGAAERCMQAGKSLSGRQRQQYARERVRLQTAHTSAGRAER